MKNFYEKFYIEINKLLSNSDTLSLEKIAKSLISANKKNKKIIIFGNGGSAAISSHVSVDLTKNAGVRCINFNEADLLTCFANDYGYEHWVSKAIEFYSDEGDLVILISSSGSSKNMLNGSATAKSLGLKLITLSGFNPDNELRKLGDINLFIDSKGYNIVEMGHHVWLLAIVDKIIGKIVY